MTAEHLIQVVIPMAGRGMRFSEAGYKIPKPLLPIHGQPMFSIVLSNILTNDIGRVVVVAQKQFKLRPVFEQMHREWTHAPTSENLRYKFVRWLQKFQKWHQKPHLRYAHRQTQCWQIFRQALM